jgi:UPF0755 protein
MQEIHEVKRWLGGLALILALIVGLAGAATAWWRTWPDRPLALQKPSVEVSIEPGTPAREVAQQWVRAGIDVHPLLLQQWFRWSGDERRIRAGSYEVQAGITPRRLLDKMVRGEETLEVVRLIEGWTLRQARAAFAAAPHLKPTTAALGDAEFAAALGLAGGSAEGRLFPDTYAYSRGVSDLTVMRRAQAAMQRHLERAWAERAPDTPLAGPDEALVLASIVEKETGVAADRGKVAAVLVNRLRIGMPLQSDPTVIYGLGEAFDGNLRKTDLQSDTPYNSYTRRGLPPTPIALPGLASLRAAVKPEPIGALFFVARGDGSSVFSDTLIDHNRAVQQYQKAPAAARNKTP